MFHHHRFSKTFLVFFFLVFFFDRSNAVHAQVLKKVFASFRDNPPKAPSGISLPIAKTQLSAYIRKDCNRLTAPKLGGRIMGTKGAELAGRYIGETMNGYGVIPYKRNFIHTFSYIKGEQLTPATRMSIGTNYIFIPEDAFPAPYAAEGEVKNYIIPDSREMGQPWILPLFENRKQAQNPNFDWLTSSYKRALMASKRGATAVLFYNPYPLTQPLPYLKSSNLPKLDIPVLFVRYQTYVKEIKGINLMTPFYLNLKYRKVYAKAANIIGIIDNNAKENVLICAHYDGFAFGTKEMPGHFAANDNASGVAVMMSLGRLLAQSGTAMHRYNYILAALSGGTSGEMGAKALVDEIDKSKASIAYVINIDRVGDKTPKNLLYVNGGYSSSAWVPFFQQDDSDFQFQFGKPEVIASDYLPFLTAGIPALSFSTNEGNKPDLSKGKMSQLNISGMANLVSFVYRMIVSVNKQQQPAFAPPARQKLIREELSLAQQQGQHKKKAPVQKHPVATIPKPKTRAKEKQARHISVTKPVPKPVQPKKTQAPVPNIKHPVGIVCDTNYKGYGVKVLRVEANTSARTAGVETGDIIMEMGKKKINNKADYIAALNTLERGQKMNIRVKRGVTVQKLTLVYF